jgi:hypothetical protein
MSLRLTRVTGLSITAEGDDDIPLSNMEGSDYVN